jgi:hypothetical protein
MARRRFVVEFLRRPRQTERSVLDLIQSKEAVGGGVVWLDGGSTTPGLTLVDGASREVTMVLPKRVKTTQRSALHALARSHSKAV